MYTQIRKLRTVEDVRAHLAAGGIDLPFASEPSPSLLASPVTFTDGSAGSYTLPNRFAVLPMEGWDGTTDGRPTDLVERRWRRFASSGCGLVWGEATAVRPDGRANPNQLVAAPENADGLAGLRSLLAEDQVVGLQLTHSGRWSRPDGAPAPRTAYRHPVLDARAGDADDAVFDDVELDELVDDYVRAARVAADAGFDFVDVKHCHGYLLHELLSARDRPGRYGGDLEGRTAFLRAVVAGIRAEVPELAVAVRLSVYDMVPFRPGPGGTGVPSTEGAYPYAFGGDGTAVGLDLAEPHRFVDALVDAGVGLVCVTAGSPYYNPHIQRPTYFPPSDAYLPPEDPLVGVARMLAATAELTAAHPEVTFVGSGFTYLQQWLPNVASAVVAAGGGQVVGLGRMMLSYPHLPADVLAGRPLDAGLLCRTFSDCTTAPRHGLVSGCYPIDDFYKTSDDRARLIEIKRRAKAAMTGTGDDDA
ncbi:MAG: NADH:flavin oxidoreductase [Actinobacteria bacterium]|nr:NADH:flavin oxidoreductase [Actinomycetota bacterium]